MPVQPKILQKDAYRLPGLGITGKLFLAMLLVCAVTALGMAIAARLSFQAGFFDYLSEIENARVEALAEELAEEYEQTGSWQFVSEPKQWRKFINRFTQPPKPPPREGKSPGKEGPPPPSPAERARRNWENAHLRSSLGLFAADRQTRIAGNLAGPDAVWLPVRTDDAVAGWLARAPLTGITDDIDVRFQKQQRNALALIAVLGIALAALVSMLLARTLIAPLRRFADTVAQLASGDFSARVAPAPDLDEVGRGGADELRMLAARLNHLGGVLESNEKARRTFMAEIAHDLRTPLAVLRGEIEALEDGVRPVTPAALASLRAEVELLTLLVEDVRTLSLADLGMLSYSFQTVDACDLFASVLTNAGETARSRGLRLETFPPGAPLLVRADPARLTQALRNVLGNSLRYTDSSGVIQTRCSRDGGMVLIDVLDSPPGVPEAELPMLFERFHTGDVARSRATSGSGLGLAICRTLVEAQGGTIRALPSPLGGIWIRISLPENSGTVQ